MTESFITRSGHNRQFLRQKKEDDRAAKLDQKYV